MSQGGDVWILLNRVGQHCSYRENRKERDNEKPGLMKTILMIIRWIRIVGMMNHKRLQTVR